MAGKRRRSTNTTNVDDSAAVAAVPSRPRQRTAIPLPDNVRNDDGPTQPRRKSSRALSTASHSITNPDANPEILDGLPSMRASPDSNDLAEVGRRVNSHKTSGSAGKALANSVVPVAADGNGASRKRKGASPSIKTEQEESIGSFVGKAMESKQSVPSAKAAKDVGMAGDPEDDEDQAVDNAEEDIKAALSRPPPVNSDYLPLPWKGRLGYACLNTYLRNANPPVFSSRTCRIASILEHRHPLKDPTQPEHATKNRPDKEQPADIERGRRYVEDIGLANARDVIKMLRWNDKFGIKFMRLSSEMFPFASHEEYGYKLAPFAAETLANVGKVVAELGHRVTTHPGQFTQLGSPRTQVIDNAIRDLEFHDEMLSLLKLPPQQDRDAVMILHLGGMFGDKAATLDRFRENYARLSQSVKNRLVLENDDVIWSVHDLLPLCQELNIPHVLDFHHHNIIFDSTQLREGTKDIVDLFPVILETWKRKNITPKMHYSEPTPPAITGRDRRKHSPRVMTLPPCPDTMDLMIEAKDKEQAVFELMRTFKLPGFHLFSDVTPHVRHDENRPWKPKPKKAGKKGKKAKKPTDEDLLDEAEAKLEDAEEEDKPPPLVPEAEINMGGPEGRVYWPPGMEDWLRPPKRIVKKKDGADTDAATPAKKKRKTTPSAVDNPDVDKQALTGGNADAATPLKGASKKVTPKRAAGSAKKKTIRAVPTPEPSDEASESSALSDLGDEDAEAASEPMVPDKQATLPKRARSGRAAGRVSYKEEASDMSA